MADLDELYRQYRQSLPEKRDALRRAWDSLCGEDAVQAQVVQLHLLLHRLAGSAGTYGFERLAALARGLERDWSAWLALPEAERDPPYLVCIRQAGGMVDLLAALRDEV